MVQKAFRMLLLNDSFGEEAIVRMCWAYAKIKIETRAESCIKNKSRYKRCIGIDILHFITLPNSFITATKLFLKTYHDHNEFLDFFKEQCQNQHRNWFLGAAPNSPSTNNALESFKKVIKDSNTLRERFLLAQFLVVASDMINEWSEKYLTNPEDNVCATLPKEVFELRKDEYYTYYAIPTGESINCRAIEEQ